jgi:hypothetical protein
MPHLQEFNTSKAYVTQALEFTHKVFVCDKN